MDSDEPTGTPLPEADSPAAQRLNDEDPNYLSAYNACLTYEAELDGIESKLRHVRILGYLLIHAPTRGIQAELTKCIHSRKNNSDLTDVGSFFERYFILIFKKFRGRTPKPSEHPSRPSFEIGKNKIKVDITEAPKDHQGAKDRALIRDNWRCVVTGIMDRRAPEEIKARRRPMPTIYTECAHIIPEAIFISLDKSEDNNNEDNLEHSASILAVLKQFHYDISEFNGEKVHSLTNVMSLGKDVHEAFDRLELYFEATTQMNCYEIKWFGDRPTPVETLQYVTFSTEDPVNLPVPSPSLLKLHAACCKVAHLSGASGYIDKIYRDAEMIGVLSADGASGDMLN